MSFFNSKMYLCSKVFQLYKKDFVYKIIISGFLNEKCFSFYRYPDDAQLLFKTLVYRLLKDVSMPISANYLFRYVCKIIYIYN